MNQFCSCIIYKTQVRKKISIYPEVWIIEIDIIKESFLSILKSFFEHSQTKLTGTTIGIRSSIYNTHMYVKSLYSQSGQFP